MFFGDVVQERTPTFYWKIIDISLILGFSIGKYHQKNMKKMKFLEFSEFWLLTIISSLWSPKINPVVFREPF